MSDRVWGAPERFEMPPQLHGATLADTSPGGFQDRCLKPLGHPSKPLMLFSFLRTPGSLERPIATGLLPNVLCAPVYGSLERLVNERDGICLHIRH
jgi:hypothetical protein